MLDFLKNFAYLFQESAPWLLLGLLIAGIMKWLLPIDLLTRHMGKASLASIIKAAFVGAPLPLCSCGVIPAAIGLRRSGASKPATLSFLVATPETGVDSISVSYALLGPFMAVIRPLAAILSAIFVGILALFLADKGSLKQQNNLASESSENKTSRCCKHSSSNDTAVSLESEKKSCCSVGESLEILPASFAVRLKEKLVNTISYASGKLLNDISRWLLIGLLLAAAVKTWVPTDFLTQWGDGFMAMLVMALIGVPMYICATASTPIAAGFLAIGLSPGAVLVFMLAGPATNISTMGMIRLEMGYRMLWVYLFGIISSSILLGYLCNWLVGFSGFEIYRLAAAEHQMSGSEIHAIAALILAFFILKNFVQSIFKRK